MILPIIYNPQAVILADWYDFFYFELKNLALPFSWLPVVQLLFVACFILRITIFLPSGPHLSQIIYRVIASSLFRIILTSVYDVVPRFLKKISNFLWIESKGIGIPHFETNLHEYDQSLFKSIGLETQAFTSETAFGALNGEYMLSDPLYSHFFLLFSLVLASVFIYSISHGRSVWPTGEVEFPILTLLLVSTSLALLHVERLIDLVRLLEIATLGTYVLVGYERNNRFSALAGVQYLIIGTLPSAALILAVALIYKSWGGLTFHELDLLANVSDAEPNLPLTTYNLSVYDPKYQFALVPWWLEDCSQIIFEEENFIGLLKSDKSRIVSLPDFWHYANLAALNSSAYTYISVLAALLVRFNLFFKLTAAPFQFWAPSVYGNAPLASVTFVSILSKVFVLAIRVKLLWTFFHAIRLVVVPLLLIVAVLSVFAGTLGALIEQNTKRFYVYSSRGHVGFILAGVSFLYLSGIGAQFHYLAIYILTSYARWFFLLVLGPSATHLVHLSRLKDYPQLGMFLTFLLFSISGLPPLAGFYVKLDIFIVLLESSRFYTAYALYFLSVVSFFYYLRLIKIFFFDNNNSTVTSWEVLKPKPVLWLLCTLTLTILLYGIFVERSLLLAQIEILSALI